MALQRRVPVRYFFPLLREVLPESGVDAGRVLEAAGLAKSLFENRSNMLSSDEVDSLVSAAIQCTGRSDLGFENGRRIKLNSHELLGYGLLSCPTIDMVLRLASRHYHLILETWSMKYQRRLGVGECFYTPLVALPQQSMQFFLEALTTSFQSQFQQLAGSGLVPYDIYLSLPEPPHVQRYTTLIPARFHFEAATVPGVRVCLPGELLDVTLALGDAEVMRQIDESCANLGFRPPKGDAGWTDYVRMVLREARGAPVTMEDIAQRVKVSARTIDRYLKKDGLGFRELGDQVRFDRACDMLNESGATVAAVALKLGFSETSNFVRAFRRVKGVTPSEYQRQASAT